MSFNPPNVCDWRVFAERRRHEQFSRVPDIQTAIRDCIIPRAGGKDCTDQNKHFQHSFHTDALGNAWQTVNYLIDVEVENTIRLEELCRNWQPIERSPLLSQIEADVQYLRKCEIHSQAPEDGVFSPKIEARREEQSEIRRVACSRPNMNMNNPSGKFGRSVFQQERHESYRRIPSLDSAIQELIIPRAEQKACTDQNKLFHHLFHATDINSLWQAVNYLMDIVAEDTIRLEELCRSWQPVEESPLLSQIAKDLAKLKSCKKKDDLWC